MRVVCAAIFTFAAISAAPVSSETNAPTAIAQNRVIGSWMNSLLYHADSWRAVPSWMKRMADAKDGQTITAQAGYDMGKNNPPNWNQNWPPIVA